MRACLSLRLPLCRPVCLWSSGRVKKTPTLTLSRPLGTENGRDDVDVQSEAIQSLSRSTSFGHLHPRLPVRNPTSKRCFPLPSIPRVQKSLAIPIPVDLFRSVPKRRLSTPPLVIVFKCLCRDLTPTFQLFTPTILFSPNSVTILLSSVPLSPSLYSLCPIFDVLCCFVCFYSSFFNIVFSLILFLFVLASQFIYLYSFFHFFSSSSFYSLFQNSLSSLIFSFYLSFVNIFFLSLRIFIYISVLLASFSFFDLFFLLSIYDNLRPATFYF
ncbi:unnamed protein product [Acanthosepion pharaonis]|uniref:Uncharacterized protein n=1 Tax=Acanthosepion pharaonis TaxID=158019 RepID=A0A812E5K9_ACAPH|nr:unnamed protein product [Sepia pharaonis]